MLANCAYRIPKIVVRGRLDGHGGLPAGNDVRCDGSVEPGLSGRDIEKFAERLKRLDAIPGPDRSLDELCRCFMAIARATVYRIDQNVGVKADHRSCISSRLKRRPPRGRPTRMSSTRRSIACSRSCDSRAE